MIPLICKNCADNQVLTDTCSVWCVGPVTCLRLPAGRLPLGREGVPLLGGDGVRGRLGSALLILQRQRQRDQLEGLCPPLCQPRGGEERRVARLRGDKRSFKTACSSVQVDRLEVVNKQYVRVILVPGADTDTVRTEPESRVPTGQTPSHLVTELFCSHTPARQQV